MSKTSKKKTGVSYTPKEFKKLNKCVECGHALKLKNGQRCNECDEKNIPKCKMCEIILRNGRYTFYSYDIKEHHRENGVSLKPIKELIREFTFEVDFKKQKQEDLCDRCIDWQSRMKNTCWYCKGEKTFINTKENYKLNGNLCETHGKLYLIPKENV